MNKLLLIVIIAAVIVIAAGAQLFLNSVPYAGSPPQSFPIISINTWHGGNQQVFYNETIIYHGSPHSFVLTCDYYHVGSNLTLSEDWFPNYGTGRNDQNGTEFYFIRLAQGC